MQDARWGTTRALAPYATTFAADFAARASSDGEFHLHLHLSVPPPNASFRDIVANGLISANRSPPQLHWSLQSHVKQRKPQRPRLCNQRTSVGLPWMIQPDLPSSRLQARVPLIVTGHPPSRLLIWAMPCPGLVLKHHPCMIIRTNMTSWLHVTLSPGRSLTNGPQAVPMARRGPSANDDDSKTS